MKKKRFEIVVAGHVCIDITPEFPAGLSGSLPDILTPGKLVNIGDATISTGGAVSNTGLALARLGVRTGLMGKVGDDMFGNGIRSLFNEQGAQDALTVAHGEKTSYSVILSLPGVDRMILHNPGSNDTFSAKDINYKLAADSRIFHFGYPPLMRRMYLNKGRELVKIFKQVKESGVITSMDMSLPDPFSESGRIDWKSVFTRLMPCVDIAPFSAEEAMFALDRKRFDGIRKKAGRKDPLEFFAMSDFLRLADELLNLGAAIALIKCGSRGLLLKTANSPRLASLNLYGIQEWHDRVIWKNVFPVKNIASATGAGDSAIAGFLTALLRDLSPEKAVSAAACVGAQNVRTFDAVSGIGSWKKTLELMRKMKPASTCPGSEWVYDNKEKTWSIS